MKQSGSYSRQLSWATVILFGTFIAGCGSGGDGGGNGSLTAATHAGAGPGAGFFGHGPAPVAMRSAANFRILASSKVSNIPTSAITGEVGLYPAAGSVITGFTCPEIKGSTATPVHEASGGGPAPCSFNDATALNI